MASQSSPQPAAESSVILLDLGKKKKKHIKGLRRGDGRLTGELKDTLDELRADGSIDKGAAVVVVVVREKKKNKGYMRWY